METHLAPQELCLSCGICCDGTLFGGVNLKAGDLLAPLQAGGILIQTKETQQSFKQPCAAHRQGCCQVYADRPSTCRTYRCELLKKYEDGVVSWTEARAKIGRAQRLRQTIETEMSRLVPECGRMSVVAISRSVPARAELAANPDLRKNWAPLMLHLAALLDCLQTSFLQPRKDRENDNSPDLSGASSNLRKPR